MFDASVSAQTRTVEGVPDGYATLFDGSAGAIEVALGDYSVQLELDNYGVLVIDVLNAITGRQPVVMEQHGRRGHDGEATILLVK